MRIRKPRRPRNEFAALEAKLRPEMIQKAQEQFLDGVLHGKIADVSVDGVQEQFRILEMLRTRNARRDRFNAKQHKKRLQAILTTVRPQTLQATLWYVTHAPGGPDMKLTAGLLAGAAGVDLRLTKKFLREMAVVSELLSPAIAPSLIDAERAAKETTLAPQICYAERSQFELRIVPTPLPESYSQAFPETGIRTVESTGKGAPQAADSRAA